LAVTGNGSHRRDDFPQHDADPVADALGWAYAVGLHVVLTEGDVVLVWCSGCEAELGIPAQPTRPRYTARRVRAFVAEHHGHVDPRERR
jgi:hypothetical protein